MPVYTVPVKFVFEGKFLIEAPSGQKAQEHAEKHCGLVLGGNIHSTLPAEDVDWDFSIHPDRIVGKAGKTPC